MHIPKNDILVEWHFKLEQTLLGNFSEILDLESYPYEVLFLVICVYLIKIYKH